MENTPADSYSVLQASKLLRVSQRRVRQFVHDDKALKVTQKKPLRVLALDVITLRDKRKSEGKENKPKTSSDTELMRQSITALEKALEFNQRALTAGEESARRNEDNLREVLTDQKAEIVELRRELAELRNKKRGFFR